MLSSPKLSGSRLTLQWRYSFYRSVRMNTNMTALWHYGTMAQYGVSYLLLTGSCGRSDLPESNGAHLMNSLKRLAGLSEEVLVLPGHNYAATTHSSIGQEKSTNGVMQQALARGGSIMPLPADSRRPTTIRLPDYIGACKKAIECHQHSGFVSNCYKQLETFFQQHLTKLHAKL